MATYNVASGAVGTAANVMVASTADTVTFDEDLAEVEVIHVTGTAEVWYTLDGTTPTVGGAACYLLPVGGVDRRQPKTSGDTVVKLISSGTPTVRVQRGD